ncbi:sensor histidine kinase [Pontibacter arcticus]|uniref:histidine kinase n=1 Tax=Pontibacter arcticus TaxID=2080288 RepID=A0A364RF92_9BACT|nr:GAF domain-containing sensor histidine kinase [Pontibacter arcticus]RAU82915.1 histidine kinase [Pontibacter arcticus]
MINIANKLSKEIEAVKQIPMVPHMLHMLCQTTGMGFSAVARVTEDKWIACSVHDQVQFGLEAGGELPIETTLCNEIRDHRQPVIIDNVAEDPIYKYHHTPRIYGLQSYISFPIILRDGSFFGTLCAIDTETAKVNNPNTIALFKMFADLLAFHLESLDLLDQSEKLQAKLLNQNKNLANANFNLDNFVYTASHDLKSPVNNLQGLLDVLSESFSRNEINRDEIREIIQMMQSSLARFSHTVQDLTTIIMVEKDMEDHGQELNVLEVVDDVKQEISHLIDEAAAVVEVKYTEEIVINFSKNNFKSILTNLLTNALKYRSSERQPKVVVNLEKVAEKVQLSVTDNGLGIPPDKQDKVFSIFKRFHTHIEGTGVGLYIVKRIMDNVGGEIQLDSEVDKGTTFTLVF